MKFFFIYGLLIDQNSVTLPPIGLVGRMRASHAGGREFKFSQN